MRTNRDRKRIRKQTRKRKLRYLRDRLAETTDTAERKRLIAKMQRVSPTAPVPEV
ncbi:MAG: hypothetical protein U9R15_08505 [Chloroflexota bacterium]|nr:hypothetical protein [Chloroflexota bacterium]